MGCLQEYQYHFEKTVEVACRCKSAGGQSPPR